MKILFSSLLISVVSFAAEDTAKYNWQWLNQLIDEKNITTIEELLPELPEALRRDYVLMYKSRSIQHSDYQAPRAILNWDHGRKVISFNEGPNYKGGNSIEMIQFNEIQRRFEFHRLDFESGKPPKRDQNLQRCHGCHRADPRPNWEHYFDWPGAYGAHDDQYDVKETNELNKFIPFSKTHPRYKHLVNIDIMKPHGGGRNARNISFTERLGALNMQRIARLASETTDFHKYKFAVVGAVFCPEFHLFFPPNQRPPSVWKAVNEFDTNFYTGKVRWIFESRNIKIDDWFMNFLANPNTNAFTMPGLADRSLVGTIAHFDKELLEYVNVTKSEYENSDGYWANEANCYALIEKSKEVLRQ